MKTILLLLISISCFSQRKYIPQGSSSSFRLNAGDTGVLHGNYGYQSFSQMYGDSLHHIVFTWDTATMKNGFEFHDCKWIDIVGKLGNFTINPHVANSGNVAINIEGKSGHFQISGVITDSCYSSIWFKTEPTLHIDTSYWSTLVMDGIWISDCVFRHSGFESIYIGSTDQKADRKSLAFDGFYYFPYPSKVANVQLDRITVDSSIRTGAQVSGLIKSNSYMRNCTFSFCGLSYESNHGACFRLGGRSEDFTVSNCSFSNSWLYAVQFQGSGLIKFTKNTVSNATRLGDVINPQKMASVEFDAYGQTTYIIKNNITGYSNNMIGYVINALPNLLTKTGNVFLNNTGIFQNFSDVKF